MVSNTAKELLKQSDELRKQAREVEKKDEMDELSREAAYQFASLRNAFIEQGFSEGEAYDLVKLTISMGGKK